VTQRTTPIQHLPQGMEASGDLPQPIAAPTAAATRLNDSARVVLIQAVTAVLNQSAISLMMELSVDMSVHRVRRSSPCPSAQMQARDSREEGRASLSQPS
jgi:hypothetical protein